MKRKTLSVMFFIATALVLLPATTAFAQYVRTDLVSNQTGVAPGTDQQHLVNAWGLVSLPTSPFWVSDNGTGFSTLYTGTGQQVPLFVTIPPAPGSPAGTLGVLTGVVGNTSLNPTDFTITENNKSGRAVFLFATLDGTITGWNPGVDGIDPTTHASHATLAPNAANRSNVGAVYTGLAIGKVTIQSEVQSFLYAADGGLNRRIDVFNGSFKLVQLSPHAFEDPGIPRDFTPYGIQNVNGDIWVAYTGLNKAQGGFVDKFKADGTLISHFAVHGPLHSPWGLAQAPANFGPMSKAILVSNNIPAGGSTHLILIRATSSGHFEMRAAIR